MTTTLERWIKITKNNIIVQYLRFNNIINITIDETDVIVFMTNGQRIGFSEREGLEYKVNAETLQNIKQWLIDNIDNDPNTLSISVL